jgi:hypothetical protein
VSIGLVQTSKQPVLAQVRKNEDNSQVDQKLEPTCLDEPDPIICPDAGQQFAVCSLLSVLCPAFSIA